MHVFEQAAKQAAMDAIEAQKQVFCGVSDAVWEAPELSLKEFRAAALYARVLREQGFSVQEGLCGIPTAFCGSFGQGGPVIGILGEFDALSGLSQQRACAEPRPITPGGCGHGCGHNMLGAGSLAAAFGVKQYLQATGRPGTVIFYGCPGEEGGAGKAFMAREGLWHELDAALCWHPSDVNEVTTGTNNSSIQVLYRFHGQAAHAAGDPENGRSALDAAELMNVGVQFLREHMSSECRVHYAFVDAGGVSSNVVQANAALVYMVRANKVRDSVKLLARVDKIAQGAALMTETRVERLFVDGTAELVPNTALEKALYHNFAALGVPQYNAEELALAAALKTTYDCDRVPGIGPSFDPELEEWMRRATDGLQKPLNDFLLPYYSGNGFVAGSSDVGDVSWQTPTAQVHVAAFPSGARGHSWQNVSAGGSSIGHKALLHAGKVLAATAIDLIEDPTLLAAAHKEFEKRTAAGYVCPIEPGVPARSLDDLMQG